MVRELSFICLEFSVGSCTFKGGQMPHSSIASGRHTGGSSQSISLTYTSMVRPICSLKTLLTIVGKLLRHSSGWRASLYSSRTLDRWWMSSYLYQVDASWSGFIL